MYERMVRMLGWRGASSGLGMNWKSLRKVLDEKEKKRSKEMDGLVGSG
jgi:hypothetical protein